MTVGILGKHSKLSKSLSWAGDGDVPDPKKYKHESEMKKLAEKVDATKSELSRLNVNRGGAYF